MEQRNQVQFGPFNLPRLVPTTVPDWELGMYSQIPFGIRPSYPPRILQHMHCPPPRFEMTGHRGRVPNWPANPQPSFRNSRPQLHSAVQNLASSTNDESISTGYCHRDSPAQLLKKAVLKAMSEEDPGQEKYSSPAQAFKIAVQNSVRKEADAVVSEPILKTTTSNTQGRRNDVEIITFMCQNRSYAEFIETEVKSLGLRADQIRLSSPSRDILRFVKGLAQNGTLISVVISNENENHGTVTAYFSKGNQNPEFHPKIPLSTLFEILKTGLKKLDTAPEASYSYPMGG